MLKKYIRKKIRVFINKKNQKIIKAIMNNNLEKVKLLVRNGVSINYVTKDGVTILMLAIKNNDLEIVKYFGILHLLAITYIHYHFWKL